MKENIRQEMETRCRAVLKNLASRLKECDEYARSHLDDILKKNPKVCILVLDVSFFITTLKTNFLLRHHIFLV